MIEKKVTIKNKLGLHARAASKFVETASQFSSTVLVDNGKQEVNGKSIMAVMLLAASIGTELTLRIDGEDEELSMQGMIQLIDNYFGEGG